MTDPETMVRALNALTVAAQVPVPALRELAYRLAVSALTTAELESLVCVITEGALHGPDAARAMAGVEVVAH